MCSVDGLTIAEICISCNREAGVWEFMLIQGTSMHDVCGYPVRRDLMFTPTD